ncbi:MAG: c-type cytochrome [Oceanospirillaceae bacterium]
MTYEATDVNITFKLVSTASAIALSLLLSLNINAATSTERMVERIKPIGQVCMEGDESCGSAAAAVVAGGPARSGEEVYTTKCGLCHAAGVSGAPKFGTADWTDRGAKGIDALLATAISGINAMPAKGLCTDCSDDELKGAIEHMLNSVP